MNLDTAQEIVLLLLKNEKAQRAMILFLAITLSVIGGYNLKSVDKSVICEGEEATIVSQQKKLGEKDALRVKQLREQRDADRLTCEEEIESAKQQQMAANDFLQCSDVCALIGQCREAGRCDDF
jgi:hypothetical protein